MPLPTRVLLALLLVVSGGYAGILLFCQIALAPALRVLSLQQYAEAFRALDRFMDARMPMYKLALLLLYVATLVAIWPLRGSRLFAAVAVCLALSLCDLAINISKQLPLNKRLQGLMGEEARDEVLLEMRERTVRYFRWRFVLSGLAFAGLCFAAVV